MTSEKPDFSGFVDKFSSYMRTRHPRFCFYGYGSFFQNQSYQPTDIDGGIIIPKIITGKQEILTLSRNLCILLTKYKIERADFNLIDCQSSRDGRFLSYTTDYTDYIKQKGEVLAGPNLLSCLNGLNFRIGVLESVSFNFRGVRNGLLSDSHFISRQDYKPENVEKTVALTRALTESLPKKLIQLKTGEIVEDKYKAVKRLQEILPGLDLTFYDTIRRLRDRNNLEALLQNPQETFEVWAKTLETFESLIKAYIETFPPQEITVRTQI